MHLSAKAYTALICLTTALAAPALAQQPPDVVTSDSLANTAMGKNALLSVNLAESGCHNTACGDSALYSDTSGSYNTGIGVAALFSTRTGNNNTATGYDTMYANSTGSNNTASGFQSLYANNTGSDNVATGYETLLANTKGSYNTATGDQALRANTTGSYNTATGGSALHSNVGGIANQGSFNTANGYEALYSNVSGYNNSAVGYNTMYFNSSGYGNAAQGAFALQANTSGNHNTALGNQALLISTTGNTNLALGYQAGSAINGGSDNIDIANTGGSATESNTIRIGTQTSSPGQAGTQSTTYIAGIAGTQVTGSAVYVTSSGQLGVLASSERFKTDIAPMGAASERIAELRPVTFKLKNDPTGTTQYGLIAEEMAKVYPELVIRGEDGQIAGVRYEELSPMLLNVVQQMQSRLVAEERRSAEEAAQIAALQSELARARIEAQLFRDLQAQVAALQATLGTPQAAHAKDGLLAQRSAD